MSSIKVSTFVMKSSPGEKGLTLLELLAALVISGFVMALAGKLFLSGQRAFHERIFDTDRLSSLLLIKGTLQQELSREILTCKNGRIELIREAATVNLSQWVQARFAEVASSEFRCFELDGDHLSAWENRFQPSLVEYHIKMREGGKWSEWDGSLLK
jgi:prepilin-type N-terminal cleavage/methylation domain-containing protein